MTTVQDIIDGNYCKNCDANCRLFVHEADCCLHDTHFGKLAVQIGTQDSNEEVHYEFAGKSTVLIQVMPKELDIIKKDNEVTT